MNEQDVLGAFLLVNNPIVLSEEEIKDLKYLFEECKDIMEDGYATIKLSLVKKLFDYYNHYNIKDAKRKREFENLQSQLKAKEEVIKEAINYIDDNTYYKDHKGHINIDDLYIILKKGSDSNVKD